MSITIGYARQSVDKKKQRIQFILKLVRLRNTQIIIKFKMLSLLVM